MIDEAQHEIRELAGELGLKLTRILRGGFGYVRADRSGKAKIVARNASRGWARLAKRWTTGLARTVWPNSDGTRRSPRDLARRSVAAWLDSIKADDELRATATGLRGFFLADPEELSLIALVDQFADGRRTRARLDVSHRGRQRSPRRRAGGAARRSPPPEHGGRRACRTAARRPRQREERPRRCRRSAATTRSSPLPATLLRRIPITPALPAQQHDAIASLKYGRATKTLLQFSKRFWRAPGRPRAFGSPLPFGAVWDGNEEQRGAPGILALLAGGGASDATQAIVAEEGPRGLARRARLARRRTARSSTRGVRSSGSRNRMRAAGTRISIRRSTRRCARGSRGRAGGCSSPASTPASSGRAT